MWAMKWASTTFFLFPLPCGCLAFLLPTECLHLLRGIYSVLLVKFNFCFIVMAAWCPKRFYFSRAPGVNSLNLYGLVLSHLSYFSFMSVAGSIVFIFTSTLWSWRYCLPTKYEAYAQGILSFAVSISLISETLWMLFSKLLHQYYIKRYAYL